METRPRSRTWLYTKHCHGHGGVGCIDCDDMFRARSERSCVWGGILAWVVTIQGDSGVTTGHAISGRSHSCQTVNPGQFECGLCALDSCFNVYLLHWTWRGSR